jgi:hypothetical protein
VTNGETIVFKGNYTVGGEGKTGEFYRYLEIPIEFPER